MTNLQLDNISKRFRNVTALSNVTFDVADGEFFVLLGPTGAGKTTTLRCIAGLESQNCIHSENVYMRTLKLFLNIMWRF